MSVLDEKLLLVAAGRRLEVFEAEIVLLREIEFTSRV